VLFGGIDLAEILAQFGWNIVEVQLGVDFFFCFAGNRFSVSRFSETVFVER